MAVGVLVGVDVGVLVAVGVDVGVWVDVAVAVWAVEMGTGIAANTQSTSKVQTIM